MAQKISLVLGVVMICLLLVSHDVTLAEEQAQPASRFGDGYGEPEGGSYVPPSGPAYGGDSGNIGRGG